MSDYTRATCLLLATLATGLQAGAYYIFSCAVMPALARGDDRTFVTAMYHINVVIINPWFMVTFLGAPLLSALAVLLHLGGGRPALVWIVIGFVLALSTAVTTMVFNVPLNDALEAAGPPEKVSDPAAVRAAFETVWVRWNTIRALTSTGSLLALSWAMFVSGRAAAGG